MQIFEFNLNFHYDVIGAIKNVDSLFVFALPAHCYQKESPLAALLEARCELSPATAPFT